MASSPVDLACILLLDSKHQALVRSKHGTYLSATIDGKVQTDDQKQIWVIHCYEEGKITLRAPTQAWLCADKKLFVTGMVVCNRHEESKWERWRVEWVDPRAAFPPGCVPPGARRDWFFLQSHHGKWLCADPSGKVSSSELRPEQPDFMWTLELSTPSPAPASS